MMAKSGDLTMLFGLALLASFAFLIVRLALQVFDPTYGRLGRVVRGALALVLATIWVASVQSAWENRNNPRTVVEAAAVAAPEPEPVPQEPSTEPASAESLAQATFRSYESVKFFETDGRVHVRVSQGSFLTAGFLRSGFLYSAKKFFGEVFAKHPGVQYAELVLLAPLVDLRGNSSEQTVLRVAFERGNANTVNWERVEIDNLSRIADAYWQHGAFGGS